MKMYIGLKASIIGFSNPKHHVTLAYDDVKPTKKMFMLHDGESEVKLAGVEYWERADVTVAVLESEPLCLLQQEMQVAGFGYNLEFIPHITLCKGRLSDEELQTVRSCSRVILEDPYIQIKE